MAAETMKSSRFKHRLSEIAVIVFSILLAFWIEAWWGSKQAANQESEILEAVELEAVRNRAELTFYLGINEGDLLLTDRFFRATPTDLTAVPTDSLRDWISAISQYWTFDPENSASMRLLEYDGIPSKQGRDIQQLTTTWHQINEDAEEDKTGMIQASNDVIDIIARSSVESVFGGQDFIDGMAARLGPEYLSQLRTNNELVSAVMKRVHRQNIYILELRDASAVLDSLLATLNKVLP